MVVSLFPLAVSAQSTAARITQSIDPSKTVTLRGNVHPLARAANSVGTANDSQSLRRMILLLGRSPEQESALRTLLEEQQSPGSSNYQNWLTPSQFGDRFGVSDSDLQAVTGWLAGNGFQVQRVSNSRTFVEFDGTVGQLRAAFGTVIQKYSVQGSEYWANANDPQIPAALAPVVKGFASLNNFPLNYYSHRGANFSRNLTTGVVTPELTTGNNFYGLSPADFATIYNSLPLLSAGNDGTGQTIAIVGETNVNADDIAHFRSVFGLGSGNTQIILDGPDPGITSLNEESEALLDVQWSSAVAPGATVKLVIAASTEVTQGVDLSALYIVENNFAGVMSESYGQCEANIGEGANLFRTYLSEQAAAQGITIVVSSGDNGAAGCDSQGSQSVAFNGLAVNGLASTPFNVAVGGTDFNDSGNFATYWDSSNKAVHAGSYTLPFVSALSYIPEMTWNDSCGTLATPTLLTTCANKSNGFGGLTLWAGSGGRSSCASGSGASCAGHAKPSWQIGVTPNDGVRDLPDLSFFAAGSETTSKSFYVICQSDALSSGPACVPDQNNSIRFSATGGTSASAPSFAGVVALAMQKTGSRFGNINYLLYTLPQNSFQDVTTGTISMPCVPGSRDCSSKSGSTGVLVDSTSKPAYSTGAGYDLATGLGTPNITNLVNSLAAAANARSATATALTLNGGTTVITGTHGSPVTVSVDVANASGTGSGPAGDVAVVSNSGISIDGTSPAYPLTSTGSGHSTASWSSQLFPGGTYDVYANYNGDGTNAASKSAAISVNISPEPSKVFAILETCSGNSLTAALTDTATIEYGSCYFTRYDVADSSTGTFVGLVVPIVTSKCTNATASCPTGSVNITDNGSPVDGGSFGLNPYGYTEDRLINLTGGTHTIVASYPGDPSYATGSGTIVITVTKAGTSISQPTSTPPSPTTGQSVQLVANVTTSTAGSPPSGTVTFYDNGSPMTGTLQMTGHPAGNTGASTLAVFTTNFSSTGSHTIRAQYGGDTNYNSSSLSPTLTVTVSAAVPVAPAISAPVATPNPVLAGSAVTLTTTVGPAAGSSSTIAPTGTVTFMDGGTALAGTVNYSTTGSSFNASLSYTFAGTGTHNITAQYSGDSVYTPAATPVGLSLNVNQPYTIAPDQTSITRTGGGTGNVTITLSPASGFSGAVNVTCTSSSAQASCAPQTGTVTVTSGNVTDMVTYTVPASASASGSQHLVASLVTLNGTVLVGFVFFAVPLRRTGARRLPLLILLLAMLFTMACGGSGTSGGGVHTPVTYTFTVKASLAANANISSSTQFTVTVQ